MTDAQARETSTPDLALDGPDLEGLRWLQDRVRELLAELNRVARDQGLRYYLAYGTAIGAVRSNDLIPWDPDADVLVPLDDYADLVKALREHLSPQFEVVSTGEGGYENLFARLAVRGIDHKIIRVDLFPLCSAPTSRWGQRLFTVYQRVLAKAYLVKNVDLELKTHYGLRKRALARLLRVALAPWTTPAIARAFDRLVQGREIDAVAGFLTNPCGAYGRREYFDSTWFRATELAPIGDIEHPVPLGLHPMLEHIYGDYMTPVTDQAIERSLRFASEHYVRPLRVAGHVREA